MSDLRLRHTVLGTLLLVAASILVGCGEADQSADRTSGSTEAAITGTYSIDMDALREMARTDLQSEGEMDEFQAEMADRMMEQMIGIFEEWSLVLEEGGRFEIEMGGFGAQAGTYSVTGNEVLMTTTESLSSEGEWAPYDGVTGTETVALWDESNQSLTLTRSDFTLVFIK